MTTEIHARSELTALGLMSGTSRDGIDAAIIRTDGSSVVNRGPSTTWTYGEEFRRRLSDATLNIGDASGVEAELTALHANVIDKLLEKNQLTYLERESLWVPTLVFINSLAQFQTITDVSSTGQVVRLGKPLPNEDITLASEC